MTEHKLSIYRASNSVESATIELSELVPESDYSTRSTAIWYGIFTSQSKELEFLLWKTLPGAIYDRLFAAMAERKASQFRVINESQHDHTNRTARGK
jgi:hypothetical protein